MSEVTIERLESLLWHPQVESLPPVSQFAIKALRFIYAILRDIVTGNITLRAMGLVYVTILSIVPAIAIVFSILKGFGFHRKLEPLLANFLLPLGERGVELTHQVMGLVENVQGNVLAGIGLVMLFITTVSMAQKVEDSFNFVWRIDQPRGLAERLSEYVSLILIIPVVMITATGLIASVESNQYVQEFAGYEPVGATLLLAGKLAPYVLVVLGFTFVYWFLPNTPVKFTAAVMGGLTGGILWAATGFLFATFVATSARTLSIYATFAIAILALIWIYLCWLILLVGALVSFYVQNPERLRLGYRNINLGGRQREQIAMSLMALTARAFRDGEPAPTLSGVGDSLGLPGLLLSPVVHRLSVAGLLTQTSKGRLYPQRDPQRIRVKSILDAVREPQTNDVFPEGSWPASVVVLNEKVESALTQAVGDLSLYDLLENAKTPVELQ